MVFQGLDIIILNEEVEKVELIWVARMLKSCIFNPNFQMISSHCLPLIENMREVVEILDIPSISIPNHLLGKFNLLLQLQKVSESNIWFSYFKLNVLEGDMASLMRAALFRPDRGRQSFGSPCIDRVKLILP